MSSSQLSRSHRSTRRLVAPFVLATALALAACTSNGGGGGLPGLGGGGNTVQLAELGAEPTISPGGTPAEASTQLSAALIGSSPAAVIADASTLREAAEIAIDRGLPLLVADPAPPAPAAAEVSPTEGATDAPGEPGAAATDAAAAQTADGTETSTATATGTATDTATDTGTASPSPTGTAGANGTESPTETGAAAADGTATGTETGTETAAENGPAAEANSTTQVITAEVDRLGATQVLSLGQTATALASELSGVEVVDAAGGLDSTTGAQVDGNVAVLSLYPAPDLANEDAELDPAAVAATTTALAVGATVIESPLGDPRATTAGVQALSEHKPDAVVAVGERFGTPERVTSLIEAAQTGVLLPGGGQTIAHNKLYVAAYGHPGAPVLGILGEQDLDATVERTKKLAAEYDDLTDQTVIPTFEIITTIATAGAGPAGNYSRRVEADYYKPWIEKAGEEGIYVMLDLQPGTDHLVDQAKLYEELLAHPHVGLAIDPEWKLRPGERHLRQIGQVEIEEVNEVTNWLADFTAERDLPQKALILHQFQTRMIINRDQLDTSRDEVQFIIHVDGQGGQAAKQDTYRVITNNPPGQEGDVVWGWKNFIDEDSPMLTPSQTMAQVNPRPVMISYQ